MNPTLRQGLFLVFKDVTLSGILRMWLLIIKSGLKSKSNALSSEKSV